MLGESLRLNYCWSANINLHALHLSLSVYLLNGDRRFDWNCVPITARLVQNATRKTYLLLVACKFVSRRAHSVKTKYSYIKSIKPFETACCVCMNVTIQQSPLWFNAAPIREANKEQLYHMLELCMQRHSFTHWRWAYLSKRHSSSWGAHIPYSFNVHSTCMHNAKYS